MSFLHFHISLLFPILQLSVDVALQLSPFSGYPDFTLRGEEENVVASIIERPFEEVFITILIAYPMEQVSRVHDRDAFAEIIFVWLFRMAVDVVV